MIRKYGKDVDMLKIKRNLKNIKKSIKKFQKRKEYKDIQVRRNKCPVCGSMKSHLFLKVYDVYDYMQCEECKGLYLINYPNIESLYSADNMDALTAEYIDETIYNDRINMISKPKVDFVMDACKQNLISVNSWLDIGCGGGEIPFYLKSVGCESAGMETNPVEIEFCREHGIKIYENYIDLHLDNPHMDEIIGRYECISLINVVEHLEEPAGVIDYLYNNMKKDSILVIEVPKHPALASFVNMTAKDNIFYHIAPPGHLQIFSVYGIERMLKNKFEILASWEFGQGFNNMLHNSMILSNQEENELYIDLQKSSNRIQKAIDECGYGDNILLVAKRISSN